MALEGNPPPRKNDRKPRNRKEKPNNQSSTVSSTPVNSDIYEGQARGSRPVVAINSQNFDFSNFPVLSHVMYDVLASKDPRIRRTLPYCLWQHYLSEILNAVVISRVIEHSGDNRFQAERHPFDVIDASTLLLPTPFLHYINGITNAILQCGDRLYFNLPAAGIPLNNVQGIESGSFGVCQVNNHNAYECYVSPFATRSLIERTLAVNQERDLGYGAWNPLPDGFFPVGGVCTPNLLGYELPENLV